MTSERTMFPAPALKRLPEHMDASQALKEGHFLPFFQPLVTLRTGQLAGFEVLARWQHPIAGLIPPDTFITVAEQDGWIGELTRQVLRKALAAAVAIPDPLTLAINISPHQLRDSGLPELIRTLAAEAKFPLQRLVVEITESALIDSPQSAADIVAELKEMGCRLALDDFGTGYSSLTHLQALRFDTLKVDRSFVGSMTGNRESRKIVAAVVGLGQSLGLTTVAEGIETQEQAEMMLWLGCDLGQGWFYGRPLPCEELLACVSKKREKLLIHSGSAWKRISAANLDSSPTQRLAQLQAVYDGAPVGLAFLDHNLRYVNLNQRLADMNGAKIEDHLGSPMAEMVPELFASVEQYIQRALDGEAVTDVEAELPQTGETRLVSYLPVNDEAGEVIGVSVAVIDITERKHAEEALKNSEAHYRSELRSQRRKQLVEIRAKKEVATRLEVSNEILRAANQKIERLYLELEQTRFEHVTEIRKRSELDTLKNEYVAMVSHELRSPLTSVRGAIGILSAGLVGSATDKGAKLFHIALTNLDRMIRLVGDVLNLERMMSGTASLTIQECSLENLSQQAIDTMTPVANGRDVRLSLKVAHAKWNVPMPTFQGDPDGVLQVLINLLSNAIKFSPPGGAVVLTIEASDDQMTAIVSDEGRGIPTDQLERVFERFQQVENGDTHRLGGTGLGLTICRTIVEQHGGAVWAERNIVKGTSFIVALPCSPRHIPNTEYDLGFQPRPFQQECSVVDVAAA